MSHGTVTPTPADAPRRDLAPGIAVPEAFTYTEPPRDHAPRATLHVRVVTGRAVCERLELVPQDGHLSSTALRLVDLGGMFERALYDAAEVTRRQPSPEEPDPAYWYRQRLNENLLTRQRGEPDPVRSATAQRRPREPIGLPEGGLDSVANIYNKEAALNGRPTKRLQDEFNISRATASRWVRRARDRGLIAEARRGT